VSAEAFMTDPTRQMLAGGLGERYTLERELARGGMSVVYRAHDRRHDRPVALKVLHGRLLTSPEHAERFLREIRFAAQLTHPHILPLYDSGEISGPGNRRMLYYVMPFVPGGSLRDRLRAEAPLPVDQALRLIRAVGNALDYAHRRQVVHRDIKPENILLHEGEPLVADFGVARALCDAQDAVTVTEPGVAVGTPAYMSPEQASGEPLVDARSDQYALACVLYELLAGQPPFAGTGNRSTMARHVTEAPRPVRALRPEVPAAVESAVLRALAKEPADRFPTVGEFCEALVTPLSGLPDAPAPATHRSIAVLPFTNASPDPDLEYVSDGMTDELIHALSRVSGLSVAPRTSVYAFKGRGEDVRRIGAVLGVGTVLEGSVRRMGDRFRITAQLSDAGDGRLLWSERFDREDRDILTLQEDLARTIVTTLRDQFLGAGPLGEPAPRRYTGSPRAYHLYLRGRHAWNKRTDADIHQAIRFFEQAIGEDPNFALAYTGLADAYALHVDYRAGPVSGGLSRACDEAQRALALDDSLAEAHTSLAWVRFIYDWNWDRAGFHFRRAIELDPRYATARQWYSWYLAAMGRIGESLAEGIRSVELDPASVSVRRSLGWLFYCARRPAEGIEHVQRALIMNPESYETYGILGLLTSEAGRLAEAREALEIALSMQPDDTPSLAALANVEMRAGRRAEAVAIRDRFAQLAERRYVSPTDRAKLALALQDADDAFAWLERARIERRGWLAYLRVDPLFDLLRADPRFRDLLRVMHLG
jgi:serine/threonine-protein kinase